MPAIRRNLVARASRVAMIAGFALFVFAPGIFAQTTYQKPPKNIVDVLLAPAPPLAFVNPQGDAILLAEPVRYPPIAELARPMLRIAGVRIDPANFGQHAPARFIHLALVNVSTGRSKPVAFAYGEGFGRPEWAPDGKHFFLTVTADKTVELWIGDAATAAVHRVPGIALNTTIVPAFGAAQQPCSWAPGSRELLCRTVAANRGLAPALRACRKGRSFARASAKPRPRPRLRT